MAYLALNLLQRLIYLTWILVETKAAPPAFGWSFASGVLFDLVPAVYLFLPLSIALLFTPQTAIKRRFFRRLLATFTVAPFAIVLVTAMAELFFFNEFHSRYNFIAIDYLVYSQEVLRNIWESFPVVRYLSAFSLLAVPLLWLVGRVAVNLRPFASNSARFQYSGVVALGLVYALTFNGSSILDSASFWNREMTKNSLHALFSAYFSNSIDFHQFYSTIKKEDAAHITHEWLEEETEVTRESVENETEDETSLVRNIKPDGPPRDWNVIVVVIESLSARFMNTYGNTANLTPNLDRMAKDGVFFSQLYATGTRTVRGLEALMLSMPPTPGQSILRRPNSDDLFNVGDVFKDRGYKTQFIYGGYAYFDNMKGWFSSNGFDIVDRASISNDEIHFANAWGVCDEDLFSQVLRQADLNFEKKQKFFQVVLTTSNHRPYTYPEQRIDIPSGSGRSGAVKYTDYAIGQFVAQAQQKPWFKNTLLVFVADHNAAVAGGSDIPIKDFLIPMIFYNPDLVSPTKNSKLASQVDFAPTLLGLLNFKYQSRFFGQNLFRARGGRALMGTYQKVALLEPDHLTILSPGHQIETQELDADGNVVRSTQFTVADASLLTSQIKKTVAIYQTASDLFTSGMEKEHYHFSHETNVRKF